MRFMLQCCRLKHVYICVKVIRSIIAEVIERSNDIKLLSKYAEEQHGIET